MTRRTGFRWASRKRGRWTTLDVVLMRKDPPFDMEYVYTTYLLEQAEARGSLIVNRPSALRDANEKLYTAWFPEVCSPTLVSRSHAEFDTFIDTHEDVILKPLDGMGGASIFRVRADDPNRNVIIETLTAHGTRFTMGQKFIPEIRDGDKRIIVIDGEPVPYALARVPSAGENRGNLAAGGSGIGVALSDKDREIVETVAPRLREQGILFAGLDVIGDFLTEVNVTSPTCIRELDQIIRPQHQRHPDGLHRAETRSMRMLALPRLSGTLIGLLSPLCGLAGCDAKDPVSRGRINAFGTTMEVTLIGVDRRRAAEITRVLEADLCS